MTDKETEISAEDMDALIERTQSALADGLSPEPDDVRLILQILRQFSTMQQKLEGSSYLKDRYLKLMGLVSSSENQKTVLTNGAGSGKKYSRKKKPHPKTKPVPPTVCHHGINGLEKGQVCPECEQGRIYKSQPASFIRITGQAPLTAEEHVMEQLRCRMCERLFTAELPAEVLRDGARQQRYGCSARSIMAISKFYMGNPYYRQESLQSLMGKPISASTIYDQCVRLVADASPTYDYLKRHSANAYAFNIDDTGNKILDEKSIEKPNRNGSGTRTRTGVYTSCLIATWAEEQKVVLFKTNIGHSGEWIDEILSLRDEGLPKPLVMCDALSSNTPTVTAAEISLCNSHSRRKFVEVVKNYPKEAEYAVECYAAIWQNNTTTEEENMLPKARLAYHREHSYPAMLDLKQWCETQLETCHTTEENSGLGRAIKYFLKNFVKLSAFCLIEDAQLDNNLAEMVIKLIVRGRKNSLFYKTLAGAHVGDVITSLIATCELNGINCFDYLTHLQQNRRGVEVAPECWLPWNYKENLENDDIAAA